ncbi:MAG: hypothetical protein HY820_06625 [Acidobacteria bacterium]|nr:hypothetical protein [Acidobacteriota bacterium]
MANSLPANSVAASAAPLANGVPVAGLWAKLLLPSFSDCLFLAVLFWLYAAGWPSLLADGDTGWHIRTGEWILQNRAVPQTDLFSFSKAGQPWYAWEWLADVVYALLHGAMGLKAIVLLSALLIAGFGTLLFRHMVWCGATPFAALVVSLMVFGASAIHYLARPHVFTLFGMTAAMFLLERDRQRPGREIWWLVAAVPFWVNLHGGFLALIAVLVLLTVGTAAEQWLVARKEGSRTDWGPAKRYGVITAAAGLLTFANPYGWHLHQHILAYLRSDWIKANVQEFRSPVFRGESATQYEVMLFAGLGIVAWLLWRRQVVSALWILFWAHSSLTSVRHVPLFMIVAAPYVAMGLTALWKLHIEPAGRKTTRGILASLARDMTPGCSRSSVWIVTVALVLPLLPDNSVQWPTDFPAVKFPTAMVARHAEELIQGRTLTMDQWGDYLIYKSYPRQRVFVDGRSDFFGAEMGDEYLRLSQGTWDWRKLMEKHNFDVVLSPMEWPLTSLLKTDVQWRVVDDDGIAVLFKRAR